MKKIILTILLILSISFLNAQEIILKKETPIKEIVKGTHYKTEKKILEKFEGIWVFKNGEEIFKIQIKTEKFYNKLLDVYVDILIGRYCYNQDEKDCQFNNEENRISSESTNQELESGFSYFMFMDVKYDKVGKAKLEILENGSARWTLKNRTMVHDKDWEDGFSIPTDVILIKIE